MRLQAVGALKWGDGVPFAKRAYELLLTGEVKGLRSGAEAKASLNRALESVGVDAKPCDLPMIRLKVR